MLTFPASSRSECSPRRAGRGLLLAAVTAFCSLTSSSEAQVVPEYGRYQPLNQFSPPGLAARWSSLRGLASPDWSQPVRVILDGDGEVTFYHSRPVGEVTQVSPAQIGMAVGHSYRLKLSNMAGLPGVELYPTLEVIDRLHPPAGQKHEFPVPVHISRDDIELALSGHLVTRVVYLEQPQFAAPYELDDATRVRQLLPDENPIEQADRFGRPMIIVRLGGRMPAVHGEPVTFWGSGGPLAESVPAPKAPASTPAGSDDSGPAPAQPAPVPGDSTTQRHPHRGPVVTQPAVANRNVAKTSRNRFAASQENRP